MSTCEIDYGQPSYRGLPFEILQSSRTQGRRLSKNLYPFVDQHYNEDLGDVYDTFTISGVFTGERARDNYTVAQRLWKVKGEGILFEPTGNLRHAVQVEQITWQFEAFKINYIPFTLTLVEAAQNPYPITGLNIFGRINGIIDNFITTASEYYVDFVGPVNQFRSVVTGFEAAGGFIYNTARQTVSGSGYSTVATSILSAQPSSISPITTFDAITDVFETAAQNESPTSFYRQGSEVRVVGNDVEAVQGHAFALNALAYYFDDITSGTDIGEIERFITRAEDLKNDVVSNAVKVELNRLIMTLGALENVRTLSEVEGPQHALVASYNLYGDVSRAYEILKNSGGVSGANLNVVRFE